MSERIKTIVASVARAFAGSAAGATSIIAGAVAGLRSVGGTLAVLGLLGAGGYLLVKHPPLASVPPGSAAIRTDTFTGSATQVRQGNLVVIPGLHTVRIYPLGDQVFHPEQSAKANGEAPFQSVEGLSLGVDVSVRYALDPAKLGTVALPQDIGGDLVAPAVQGVIYRIFAAYTVREIFSTKRAEIQHKIETELKPALAADGISLRTVQIGKVDLPADYRAGMEKLLAEELESEKMRYTLELKDKEVQESALVADADKVRREKAAEAAALEQVIAAKAQEESMQHVLPFKQKQIEQHQLEAEAEKITRVKAAEAAADSRRIEADAEADSRRKLADAEIYRLDKIGKVNSEQMARDGEIIAKNPLLIQKTMADKLSDKISVIIAPPPADGGFIGSTLLGTRQKASPEASPARTETASGEPMMLAAALTTLAIVTQDQVPLRAAPDKNAPQHAMLWQGDNLEIRGARQDYLQVYDHRHERARLCARRPSAHDFSQGRGRGRTPGGGPLSARHAGPGVAGYRLHRRLSQGGAERRNHRRAFRRSRDHGRPLGAARLGGTRQRERR